MNGVATQKKSNQEQDGGTRGLPWYDSKEGLEAAACSLGNLIKLQNERHAAGYGRKERLHNFYILGRYSTDSCGNFGKLEDYVPKEHFPQIAKVMTDLEMREYLNARLGEAAENIHLASSIETHTLPAERVRCSVCQKGWTIENCHDFVTHSRDEKVSYGNFVGQTLADVQAFYELRTDTVIRVKLEIRNDRHIDLSLRYPEDKASKLLKNQFGWLNQDDGINYDYIIQEGDEGCLTVTDCYHQQCNQHNLLVAAEMRYKSFFQDAGFRLVYLRAVANQYCHDKNCTVCAPWFEVETEFGTILFGFRNSVFKIDWSGLHQPIPDLLPLFEKETVTKNTTSIHAHQEKKVIEYLSIIRQRLTDVLK